MPDAHEPLCSAFSSFAGELALIAQERTLTFRELNDEAAQMADILAREDLFAGERLAILLPPSIEYVVLLLACVKLNITACPLSTRLPREGVAQALDVLRAKTLAGENAPYTVAGPSCVGRILIRRPQESMPSYSAGQVQPCVHDAGQSLFPPEPNAAVAVFTSGSSGVPKAALLTLDNLCANAAASNRNIPVGPGDHWLLSVPLFHVSGVGVVFRCLLSGAAVVIPAPNEDLTGAIERYSITHVSVVPTQLRRALRKDPALLQRLKAILLGGSPVPDTLIADAIAARLPLFRTYGLTETASQVTTTRLEDGTDALYTSGKPIAPDTISLSDDNEILVRGDTLFAGYIHGDSLDRPLTPDGWFATRDLGRFDAHGNLVVTGRKDNMFISGGENIQPEEIEAVLCRIKGVLQAVVVPMEDPEFGQRPVAFVQTEGMMEPEQLRQQLARTLPAFKVPKDFFSWPAEFMASDAKVNRLAFAQSLKTK